MGDEYDEDFEVSKISTTAKLIFKIKIFSERVCGLQQIYMLQVFRFFRFPNHILLRRHTMMTTSKMMNQRFRFLLVADMC